MRGVYSRCSSSSVIEALKPLAVPGKGGVSDDGEEDGIVDVMVERIRQFRRRVM